ncbi:MAG: ABC transporter permease [Bryobacteraceae bacterium]|nr:ABC transporter permease [Bryobacteraceae bacterium]
MSDFRFAVRMLAKSPVLTAVAVLSLGLGIGANLAIFTVVNAVLLKPLPVEDLGRLVSVFTTDPRNPGSLPVSHPNLMDYRARTDVLSGLAGYHYTGVAIGSGGEPEQATAEMVSGNYFDLLGVKPILGRAFRPEEDRTPGSHPVTVISHNLWTRRFGADPAVLHRKLTINGRPFTVAGVAPPEFRGVNPLAGTMLWIPTMMYRETMGLPEMFDERRFLGFFGVARLKSGVSLQAAEQALMIQAAELAKQYPSANQDRGIQLLPLAEAGVPPQFRGALVQAGGMLMTIVGVVLLIASANIANLLLARMSARRKEIAIRAAMGASKARIVRQLLSESLLMAGLGGIAGVAIGIWAKEGLWAMRPPFLEQSGLNISLDWNVAAFAAGLTLLSGILFGLAPAFRAARADLAIDLRDRGAVTGRGWLRNSLVVGQVALSMVALAGAGLFLHSLGQAQAIDPGFDTPKLALISFSPGRLGYNQQQSDEHYRRAMERAASAPGVESVALSSNGVLGGGGFARSVFLEGAERGPNDRGVLVLTDTISPRYFRTAGIELLRGRDFQDADRQDAVKVVIVNQFMAERFWPGQDAVGKRFRFHGDAEPREVVGVARTASYFNVGENPQPCVYLPEAQEHAAAVSLVIRAADPAAALAVVRREVQALDPNLPLAQVVTLEERFAQGLWAPRMAAALLSLFGVLALLLASIGIYGVMAYTVSRRSPEIGVRMALGASPREVWSMIIRQGLSLVIAGLAFGLAAAFGLSRLITGMLYGSAGSDWTTFPLTALVLLAVALAALAIPARRAMRVDPVIALREE